MRSGALLKQRFENALEQLLAQTRQDRSILAAVLCGSLSHDTVWEKSDIDLMLVTIDDKRLGSEFICLVEDELNIHACLMTRSDFRRMADGSIRNSFTHSLLSKGRLLYSHDPSIDDLFQRLQRIGSRDTQDELLKAGITLLPSYYKAQKWFRVREDLHYTALWLLYSTNSVAKIEVMRRGLLADREVIPQALKLNPALMQKIYLDLLDKPKTKSSVKAALGTLQSYLDENYPILYAPIVEYLQEAGEIRSATEIENDFQKHRNISGVTLACEYLADQGVITKASAPAKLTRKSNVEVNELAFVYLGEPPDA